MPLRYNKLIRDNIPSILAKQGVQVVTHNAVDDDEYWLKLKEKLQEELNEFAKAEDMNTLADVFQIIDEICIFKGFDEKEINAIRENKNIEFGGFEKRLILDESPEEIGESMDHKQLS